MRLQTIGTVGSALLALMLGAALAAAAPTVVKPGFSIFSVEQDVEIGHQSAVQVEKHLPMLNDPAAQRFVSALGARLAAQAPGPRFAYRFKLANRPDLNAFALPGGNIYIHRGLLDQVRSEGELAGVMAHEIAHVALRHPTNQASKAYLAQAGLGVLGGLLTGRASASTNQIIGAIGGFGMNTLFLKFSRSAETQADIVGAQIMARAGYDPVEMARFFAYMDRKAGGSPGAAATFLSSHPAPADRETRVQQEVALIGGVSSRAPIGTLVAVQTQLRRLPAAPAASQPATGTAVTSTGRAATTGSSARTALAIERPSARYRLYRARDLSLRIERPENWTATAHPRGFGVTLTPRGGITTGPRGRRSVACGVIVNHYVPFDGTVSAGQPDPRAAQPGAGTLEEATDDLVRQVRVAHPHLDHVEGSERRATVSGATSLTMRLAGRSPETGGNERVTAVTRQLPDGHVVYVLMIAPADTYRALEPTFEHMLHTLQVSANALHD